LSQGRPVSPEELFLLVVKYNAITLCNPENDNKTATVVQAMQHARSLVLQEVEKLVLLHEFLFL
jgi:hypothetical protein